MEVGIVGGGIAGLAAALAFGQIGHRVAVFEQAPAFAEVGAGIAVPPNALACLRLLGVHDALPRLESPLQPATIRNEHGRVLVRAPLAALAGAPGGDFVVAHRALVIEALRSRLPDSALHPGSAVTHVTADGVIETCGHRRRFDLVIGADGVNSVTRRQLWPWATPRRTGITAWRWIVDRSSYDGVVAVWGRTAEFGALPMPGYGTYVYGGARRGHANLDSYVNWPDPLPELIAARDPNRVITDELCELRPVTAPVKGRVVLVGDAAHTMRPTFGQGAAQALEDVVTLAGQGTQRYATLRRRRTAALYWCSRWGSMITMPTSRPVTAIRDTALRLAPNRLFAAAAGSASRWTPHQGVTPWQ